MFSLFIRSHRCLTSLLTAVLTLATMLATMGVSSGAATITRAAAAETTSIGHHRAPDAPGTAAIAEQQPTTATVRRLAHRAARGLVDITVTTDDGDARAGTGIVLTRRGTVMTNYHVVAGATTVRVHDHGTDTDYTATVLGADRRHDVAVLRLKGASDLPVDRLGHSRRPRIGQQVISIGNAYGSGTLHAGAGPITAVGSSIASTTERTAARTTRPTGTRLSGLIRATTAIVPGDSGGATIDMSGAVIGMNVACEIDASGTPTGSGYAIPIDTALAISHRLIRAHTSA